MLDALLQTFGRSHLIVLHLPIGLLLVAAMIEVFRIVKPRKIPEAGRDDESLHRLLRQTPTPSAYTCVFFATLFGAVAAVSGWIYAGNEFTSTLWGGGDLEWHRWLGTVAAGLAGLTLILGLVATLARRTITTRIYKVSLLLAAVAVGWAGHLGGELVHGEGYVLEPVLKQLTPNANPAASPTGTPDPASTQEGTPADKSDPAVPGAESDAESGAIVPVAFEFERDIAPIFEASCAKCHRPGKAKGGLQLDTLAEAMYAIVPGDADASELVFRVRLAESDEDSMPKDKPNLPAEQIETIAAWINSMPAAPAEAAPETPTEAAAEPLAPAPEVRHTPGPQIETPPAALAFAAADQPIELTAAQEEARDAAIERLRSRMISAGERAQGLGTVEVRVFEGRANFTDDDLELLDGLQPCMTMLDLTGTAVTDQGAALISAAFPRLRVLRLGQTAVTDAGLGSIGSLSELSLLDAHQTGVTSAGLERLAESCDSLRVINAWGTQATPEQVSELRARFPEVEFQSGD
ncbi:MAG: putative membrane protein [Phycisphaerales bacterium]|jgi:uncharacterized membrane protein